MWSHHPVWPWQQSSHLHHCREMLEQSLGASISFWFFSNTAHVVPASFPTCTARLTRFASLSSGRKTSKKFLALAHKTKVCSIQDGSTADIMYELEDVAGWKRSQLNLIFYSDLQAWQLSPLASWWQVHLKKIIFFWHPRFSNKGAI